MDDPGKDIFSIKLNTEGTHLILRFCKIVNWIVLLSILTTLPSVIHNVARMINPRPHLYATRPLLRAEYVIHPYFWMFYDALWVIQVFYYWKLGKQLKKTIAVLNEEGFNRSFSDLNTVAKLNVVLLVMTMVAGGYNLLLDIKYGW